MMLCQNLLPVKDTTVDITVPTSSEQKLQPTSLVSSSSNVDSLPAANERRRRRHSGDESTRESSPVSDRSLRGCPPIMERLLRDRGEDRSMRESSPFSEQGGTRNPERLLRDRIASVGDRCGVKERSRLKRETSGTVSSSASTCSDESELRINDFLGKSGLPALEIFLSSAVQIGFFILNRELGHYLRHFKPNRMVFAVLKIQH